MAEQPRLVVVCGRSAATAGELVAGLQPLAELVFLLDPSPYTEPLRPLLAHVGQVLEVADGPAATVELLRPLRPDGIVTFSEGLLPLVAEVADGLGLPFHSPRTVAGLTDKFQQRRLLADGGADAVRTALLTSPDQWPAAVAEVGLPAMLKPARGEGSRNARLVTDGADGARWARELLGPDGGEPALVLEEFLVGRESGPYGSYISVETLVCRGEPAHIAVTGKLPMMAPFRETGQFWPARLDAAEQERALELAGRAATALGVRTGLLHTEMMLTADGPRIIEVNGRLGRWLGDLGARAAGLSLVELAGRVALGERVRVERVRAERVYFQFSHLAPVEPGRLLAADGAREVRRLPGVVGYRPLVHPGTELAGGVGTTMLDVLYGEVGTHQEMLDLIGRVVDTTAFTFAGAPGAAADEDAAPDGGAYRRSGRACSPWPTPLAMATGRR